MDGPWENLKGNEIEKEISTFKQSLNKSRRHYKNDSSFTQLVSSIDK